MFPFAVSVRGHANVLVLGPEIGLGLEAEPDLRSQGTALVARLVGFEGELVTFGVWLLEAEAGVAIMGWAVKTGMLAERKRIGCKGVFHSGDD